MDIDRFNLGLDAIEEKNSLEKLKYLGLDKEIREERDRQVRNERNRIEKQRFCETFRPSNGILIHLKLSKIISTFFFNFAITGI